MPRPQTVHRIKKAKELLRKENVSITAMLCGFSELSRFSAEFKKHCGITNAKTDKTGALIPEILTYIDENSKTDLTLVSVAERFSYTPQHFSVLFNKYIGTSFRDYLNGVRLYKVEKQLKNGNGVCNIALSEGFKSLNTYYRAKRKQEKLKS